MEYTTPFNQIGNFFTGLMNSFDCIILSVVIKMV